MGTEIFKIDASWAQKLTKTRVSFLMTPTVNVIKSPTFHRIQRKSQFNPLLSCPKVLGRKRKVAFCFFKGLSFPIQHGFKNSFNFVTADQQQIRTVDVQDGSTVSRYPLETPDFWQLYLLWPRPVSARFLIFIFSPCKSTNHTMFSRTSVPTPWRRSSSQMQRTRRRQNSSNPHPDIPRSLCGHESLHHYNVRDKHVVLSSWSNGRNYHFQPVNTKYNT